MVYILDGNGATRLTVDELQFAATVPTVTHTAMTQFSITGGSIDLTAGAGSALDLAIASNSGGAGGTISITAGASSSGSTGGDVTIQAGTGGGGAGSIDMKTSSGTSALTVSDSAVTASNPIVASSGISTHTTTGSMKMTKMLSGTCSWSGVSVGSGAVVDTACTATGASVGDAVTLSVNDGGLATDLMWNAWVSATNTITIRVHNLNAGSGATVTETFGYIVTSYTTF
jgi:hypothetical protein